jgi:uncharacterized membrane protein
LNVEKSSTRLAFLSYLLSVVGWLYVLLFHREDEFAVYHAKQSMTLTVVAVAVPGIYALFAWVVTWVPLVGPFTAAALFSLVIATYIFLIAAWIGSMVNALQDKMKALPVVGRWGERIPVGS